jgi:hypothetical protein
MKRLIVIVLMYLVLPSVAQAHRLEPIGTELPNVLDKGDLVAELGFDYLGLDNRTTSSTEIPVGIEFSVIKNLQFELQIPYIDGPGAADSGIGDMKVGARYQWLHEDSRWVNLSIGLEGKIPTGSEVRGLGKGVGEIEGVVHVGRHFGDRFHLMGSLGYGIATLNDDGEREQELAIRQAVTVRLYGTLLYFTEEFQYHPEFESGAGIAGVERTDSLLLSPGIIVAIRHGVEFKTSFPIGLASGDPDFSWRSQLSINFGELAN